MSMTRAYRKTSIKDVARRAGVSTTTVSYFVSGREEVCAPATAERIRTAIAELHYTPSSLTRGLRSSATRTLGICLYSPFDPEVLFGNLFFERLWRGIVRGADSADYSLLHYPQSVRDGNHSDALLDGRVDGVLLQSQDIARAAKVTQAGLPAVILARANDLPAGCGAVYAEEQDTVRTALDHLRALGHRRIAHLAGPVSGQTDSAIPQERPDDVAIQRLAAYEEQMRAEGQYDSALIARIDSWCDREGRVAAALTHWRSLPEPPTALLCANDALAVAALEAARALEWSVPAALSIVGIDDSVDAREASVPLTSIAVPVEEIGREAVACLLRLMEGAPVEACRVALPVTSIVVRGSTTAAATTGAK